MNRFQYNTCVDRYADALFRFALASLHNRMEAEDVVQDSFTRVWEHRHQVDFEKAKSYLFTTAHHLIIDQARQRHEETAVETLFQLPDHRGSAYPDVNEILHKVVATLPRHNALQCCCATTKATAIRRSATSQGRPRRRSR